MHQRKRLDTRRPFTRADAVAAGLDPGLLRGSRFRRIFRGVHIDASVVPDARERTEAALLTVTAECWATHHSAARAYGVPVPHEPDEHVAVRRQEDRRSRTGIRFHVDPDDQPRVVRGVRVASPDRVFVQLASCLSLVDLVIVGDALARRGLSTPQSLIDATAAARGSGAQLARRAAALVRMRVDSPMESRLRLLIVLAGLPEPTVNHAVRDDDGDIIMSYDLCWPEARLIVEYDGRHHAQREAQWQRDLDRRAAIDGSGWRIIVLTSRDVYSTPQRTVEMVHAALRQRGQAGVPRRPAQDWRPHFPGR